jgi:LCP family protein required for cell wall assembly
VPVYQRIQPILRGIAILAVLFLLVLPGPGSGPAQKAAPVARTAPPAAARGTLVPAPSPALPPAIPRGDARFLVLGLTQDNQRTDTIEVVQWDDAHHRVRILGVPRDIPITLPRIGTTKLVDAYATGGAGRARLMVMQLLDIPIAHYVVFSLPAMRRIVDLVGGVPIDVEKRMVYTDRRQGLFINLYPGPQVLNGEKAEEYLRFRHDPEGDIGRIRRQQHFLRAALAAVRRPSVWIRLPAIAEAARAQVQTDLTGAQILAWIRRVHGVSPDAISGYTIEGRPIVRWDDLARMKLDFWQPDPDDLRAKVRWLVTGVTPPAAKP